MTPEYRPSFPDGYRPGIAIVGCGSIVAEAHLPAYVRHGVDVIGVYDRAPDAAAAVCARFGAGRVFGSLDELLADPQVEVVDVATRPADRIEPMRRAIEAGKHVLAQKPLAPDLRSALEVVELAERAGVRLAVNQNGRYAPPWRVATLLVQDGAVGDVFAVTHLFDHEFDWIGGTPFDEIPHFVLYDFGVHWIDISRCWLDGKTPHTAHALDYRTPAQPAASVAPLGAWAAFDYDDGASVVIRSVGTARTGRPGNPFWIHGTAGTIRGSIRKGSDFVELDRDGEVTRYDLEGDWFGTGFAGTLAELLTAIAEDREPYNSGRHNLLSLQMTLAACRSADEGGRPVTLDEVDG